ncbi:MAG: replication factor C large subunit [Candidatus Saliniplasma sp.]
MSSLSKDSETVEPDSDQGGKILDWTERYRPKRLDDVIGNREAKRKLMKWARKWTKGKPKKKAVVLAGKPGVGKTSSAIAMANQMGWESLEMNASDERNQDAIKDFVGRSAVDDTFSSSGDFVPYKEGSRKLLILDEADNIFGKEDYGGIREISKTIQRTEQPIVLVVNDYYDLRRRSSTLSNLCKKIDFEPVKERDIIDLLKKICINENIKFDINALKTIAQRSKGDVRSAVRDLESIATGRDKITRRSLDALGSRNREAEIFPSLKTILQDIDPLGAKNVMKDLDEKPDYLLLWIDENLPREYQDDFELVRGYDKLSRADVFLGRVFSKQYYRFWAYSTELMSAGVSVVKDRKHTGWTKYAFPTWLRKMSDSKGKRGMKRKIGRKIADKNHTTTDRVNSEVLPYFKLLFKGDKEFRVGMIAELGLERDETAFLLDTSTNSQKVRELFEEDKGIEKTIKKSKEKKKDKKDKKEEREEKDTQKSLLEF